MKGRTVAEEPAWVFVFQGETPEMVKRADSTKEKGDAMREKEKVGKRGRRPLIIFLVPTYT